MHNAHWYVLYIQYIRTLISSICNVRKVVTLSKNKLIPYRVKMMLCHKIEYLRSMLLRMLRILRKYEAYATVICNGANSAIYVRSMSIILTVQLMSDVNLQNR